MQQALGKLAMEFRRAMATSRAMQAMGPTSRTRQLQQHMQGMLLPPTHKDTCWSHASNCTS